MTRHVRFQFRGGRASSVLGAVIVAGVLLCIVLLFLGLWILLGIATFVLAMVAIVRALVGARPRDSAIQGEFSKVDESPRRIADDS
jgi:type IV secretory pathway TrbD component